MLRKAIQITLLVALLAGVGYIGLSVWANCTVFQEAATGTTVDVPDASAAPYRVKLVKTGRTLFAAVHVQVGPVHTLSGYWEPTDDGYIHRDHTLTLDEQVFGAVLVTRR
jgi:hypothetical protein